MRRSVILVLPVLLLFTLCKKKKTADEEPVPDNSTPTTTVTPTYTYATGTRLVKIWDTDLASNGTHDNATRFFYYDSNGRLNLIKEYDSTIKSNLVLAKSDYQETVYSYNSFDKVSVITQTSYSFSSTQTTTYTYDGQHRPVTKTIVYNTSPFPDSTRWQYLSATKILEKTSTATDTIYVGSSGGRDSTFYGGGNWMYRYRTDTYTSPTKNIDNATNPFRMDNNIRKIVTPFGTYLYNLTYSPANMPTFYSTILQSGSGCNVYYFYQ